MWSIFKSDEQRHQDQRKELIRVLHKRKIDHIESIKLLSEIFESVILDEHFWYCEDCGKSRVILTDVMLELMKEYQEVIKKYEILEKYCITITKSEK